MTEQRPPYGTRQYQQFDREMQTVQRIAQLASLVDYERLFRGLEDDSLEHVPQPLRSRIAAGRERTRRLAEALQVVAQVEQETQF